MSSIELHQETRQILWIGILAFLTMLIAGVLTSFVNPLFSMRSDGFMLYSGIVALVWTGGLLFSVITNYFGIHIDSERD